MTAAPRCTATSKQTGEQCKNRPTPGLTVCRFHGGRGKHVAAKAARNIEAAKAAQAVATLGIEVETTPHQALLDEVRRAARMVVFYEERLTTLASADTSRLISGVTKITQTGNRPGDQTKVVETTPNVWLTLWNEERDRLTRVAATAIKLGIEERHVRIAEQQGAEIAMLIRRILGRLNLTDDQQLLVSTVVPEELRALAAGA